MNTHYDIIVIGLGAMGSAALYQLARRGVPALGIDQFAPPHQMGSTHGETRITRLAVGEGAVYIPLVRRTHEIWRELEAVGGEALLTLSGGYIICPKEGTAHFHGVGDFVMQTAQLAQRYGIEHELRNAADIREHLPMLKVRDNEHAFYEPTGGVVNPERAVAVQLREGQRHGATIHTNEKVLDYAYNARGVTVKTTCGTYSAGKLVLTAGPWVIDFLPPAMRKSFGVYRQVFYWIEAEDPALFSSNCFPFVIWIGDTPADYYSLFPTPPYATPAVKMVTEEYLDTTHPDEVDRTVHPHEIFHMIEHFIQNKVRGLTRNCVQAHVCLYTVTPDAHFVIDWHPGSERVLVVSPCSGHGFKHSGAIGEAVAQMVLEGTSQIDLSPFSFQRARWGPGR